jgi:hypothetical protein
VKTIIFFIVFLANFASLFATDITFYEKPTNLQFYARNDNNTADVPISGIVTNPLIDSIRIKTFKNNSFYSYQAQKLTFSNNIASFNLNSSIYSEMSEFKVQVYLDTTLVLTADSLVAGDVFLINGQSNSHPYGNINYLNEFWRSFGKHTNTTDYNAADTAFGLANGWGWYEMYYGVGAWGIELMRLITLNNRIPVFILNGGSGGSSIEYNLPNQSNKQDLTTTYGRLLYRAKKAKLADKVKAIMWHQGESNSYSSAASYIYNFNTLYNGWKSDYQNLKKVYVFQIHHGCGGDFQYDIREAQRNFAKTYSDVSVMSTVGLDGHDGCHYVNAGYNQMASWIYPLIARDFYGSADTVSIKPPDVIRAYYIGNDNKQIGIDFSEDVSIQDSYNGYYLKDYFYLNYAYGNVNSVVTGGFKSVILNLSSSNNATKLTYLPNLYYNNTGVIYQGPYLKNQKGIGALTFYNIDIKPAVKFLSQPNSQSFCTFDNTVNLQTNYQGEISRIFWEKYDATSKSWIEIPNSNSQNLTLRLNDPDFRVGKYRCVLKALRLVMPDTICTKEITIKQLKMPTSVNLSFEGSKDLYCANEMIQCNILTDGSIDKYYIQRFIDGNYKTFDSIDNLYNQNTKFKFLAQAGMSGNYRIIGKVAIECGGSTLMSNVIMLNVNNITISTAQKSLNLCVGNDIAINCDVFGYSDSFQWFKDGTALDSTKFPNSKGKNIIIKNATKENSGEYQLRVVGLGCNISNAVFSEKIKVTILDDYSIIQEKINPNYNLGENAEIEIICKNSVNTKFKWYQNTTELKDNTKFTGTASNKLSIKNLSKEDFYSKYFAITSNGNCSDTSSAFYLKRANTKLEIKSLINKIDICEGKDTTISIDYIAENCDSLQFIWKFNSLTNLTANCKANLNKLAITNTDSGNNGIYTLEIIALPGNIIAKSQEVNFNVIQSPKIIGNSRDTSISEGKAIELFANFASNDSLIYQWYKDDILIVNTSKPKYQIAKISLADFGNYYCTAQNRCNTAKSGLIKLTYNDLSSVSINYEKSYILINPNPASDYIEISLNSPSIKRGSGGVSFEIYNIFGENTTPSNLSGLPPLLAKEGMIKIDISNLPVGVYFIKIGDKFVKFVKI